MFFHPGLDGFGHEIQVKIIAMRVPGNHFQLGIGIKAGCFKTVADGNSFVGITVYNQDWALIGLNGILHPDGLGNTDIISAERLLIPAVKLIRDMFRIKGGSKQFAPARVLRDHPGGGERQDAFDDIPFHGTRQHDGHAALGVAAEIKIADIIQASRIIDDGQCVVEPFIQVVIVKSTVAAAMTVHIHTQGGTSDFTQRGSNGENMPFLHMSGEAMDHNDHRKFVSVLFGKLDPGIQANAVVGDNHAEFLLVEYFEGLPSEIISGNQTILNPSEAADQTVMKTGRSMAVRVDNLLGAVFFREIGEDTSFFQNACRRIVQKHEEFLEPCFSGFFKGNAETGGFTVHQFPGLFFPVLVPPDNDAFPVDIEGAFESVSLRSHEGIVSVGTEIVLQEKEFPFKTCVQLRCFLGIPEHVMISAQQDFPSGKGQNVFQVFLAFREHAAPGVIPGQKERVVGPDEFLTECPEDMLMIPP